MIRFANHAHVFPESIWSEGTVKRLRELLNECEIENAVAFAPFTSQVSSMKVDPNRWLADEIQDMENIIGFGTIDPHRSDVSKQAEEIAKLGLRGVKLHPAFQKFNILDKNLLEFYAAAEELGLFVCFHSGIHWHRIKDYHPLLFDELAYKFPQLRFSMEHVGGLSFFDDAVAVLVNNKPSSKKYGNVYAGITSVLNKTKNRQWYLGKERVELLIDLVGSSQLIFGLDFPYNQVDEVKEAINVIKSLEISKEDRDLILGGNMERLLGFVDGR